MSQDVHIVSKVEARLDSTVAWMETFYSYWCWKWFLESSSFVPLTALAHKYNQFLGYFLNVLFFLSVSYLIILHKLKQHYITLCFLFFYLKISSKIILGSDVLCHWHSMLGCTGKEILCLWSAAQHPLTATHFPLWQHFTSQHEHLLPAVIT